MTRLYTTSRVEWPEDLVIAAVTVGDVIDRLMVEPHLCYLLHDDDSKAWLRREGPAYLASLVSNCEHDWCPRGLAEAVIRAAKAVFGRSLCLAYEEYAARCAEQEAVMTRGTPGPGYARGQRSSDGAATLGPEVVQEEVATGGHQGKTSEGGAE